jgi:heptosyltransferase-2
MDLRGDPAAVRSILVVRYSALGDVVLATSVIAPLRARFPAARIEWVTAPALVPLLDGLPGLAAVHPLGAGLAGARALARSLRGRFDLAIDLQNKVRSALLARAAAPARIAFRRRTALQALRALVGRDPPLRGPPATVRYAEALRPLGIEGPGPVRVALPGAARSRAAALLAGVPRPRVAVAPGASNATKRWPAERHAAVAAALARRGAAVVLAGGPMDRPALDAFVAALAAAGAPPVAADLTPLPVPDLAAALAEVDLLVAGDSGPVHLSTAVGTPALALFGPTSPERWGPPPPGRALSLSLPCAPCSNHGGERCPLGHHRCMEDLAAATVIAAAEEMLSGAAHGRG